MIEVGQVIAVGKPARFEVRMIVYDNGKCGRVLLATAPTRRAADRIADRIRAEQEAIIKAPSLWGNPAIWRPHF